MKATELKISRNELFRRITVTGDGDLSSQDAVAFAKESLDSFGVGDRWKYIGNRRDLEDCKPILNKVVVIFELVTQED